MVQEHSPSVAHFCYSCQSTTAAPFSASVFSQNHACNNCGFISTGLGNVPPSPESGEEKTTQHSMTQQEDLAALFNQRLNISNFSPAPQASAAVEPASQPQSEQGQPQQQPEYLEQEASQNIVSPQPIIYASTHYTHTSHVPRASSEPTPSTSAPISSSAVTTSHNYSADDSETFQRHSIDPSALSPGQASLFRAASPDQQLRLLELWRITLPAANDGIWTNATSLEQEESLARERYDRMIEERRTGRALGQMLPHPFAAQRQQQQQQQQASFQKSWEQRGGSSLQEQNQGQQNPSLTYNHEALHYQYHHQQQQQHQQWQVGAGDMDMTDDDGTSVSIMSSPRSIASPLPVQTQNHYNNSGGVGANMNHGLQYQQFPLNAAAQQQQQHATHSNAEPYMLSGYEMLSKREYDEGLAAKGLYMQSTDPVYKAAVENQYGAFQAVREYDGDMGWFDDHMAM
ncbi:hypothetical protein IWX90DRAFT_511390 [Phyllosticta citrichinensis]|uniref:Uncharacterized protein n=1 Tax=Phyllosticta citrichinensis TaxID=1130410 RepID=A0ABR1Y3M0_9PEZI